MSRENQSTHPARLSSSLLFTLGFIGILGPLGTDALAPALPSMAKDLESTPGAVQAALGFFGIGMALGQLLIGPLSDRIGRRVFLIFGTLIMSIGALVGAAANDPLLLNTGCLVMGIGGSVSVVVVWAVVADLTRGTESARGLAIVDMFVSVGPIIGPLGGVIILYFFDWRGVFIAISLFALLCSGLSIVIVRESLPPENRDKSHLAETFGNYSRVFRNRTFRYRLVSLLAAFSVLFAYIGASPFLLMQRMGISLLGYSILFAVNGGAIVFAGAITAWLSRRIAVHKILRLGVLLQSVSAVTLLAIILTDTQNVLIVAPVLFVLVGSFGFIFGSGTALAIEELRAHTGSALAVLGSLQFLIGGLVIMLVSAGDGGLMLAISVTAVTSISALAYLRLSLSV